MRIGMTVEGDVLAHPSTQADVVADTRRAEDQGFATAWSVQRSRAYDALTTLAVAGTVTSRIDLGVGIIPTCPRPPVAPAQQVATAQVFRDGRLTLDVGISHRPVIEGLHGLSYASPAARMREYLTVLGPLLRGAEVHHQGEHYRVDGGFAVPGTSPVPIAVGALSPRVVLAAGELSDGVVTRLAGPRTLAATIVPTLHGAAAGRSAPRVIAALPVAVADDPAAARAAAAGAFGRYDGMENYRRLFAREGVSSIGELAVVGSEAEVEKQLRRCEDIGVTELWPAVYQVGADEDPSVRRTLALLAGL